MTRRANIIGTGLIGGSVGLSLREQGWHVTGDDADSDRTDEAVQIGAIDQVGLDSQAEITFVATPVHNVAEQVTRALARTPGVVTDVGSVKGDIAEQVSDSRFVPGHPMAGSEQEGLKGADASMFRGAVWVLTPGPTTAEFAYTTVRDVVRSFGADVVSLSPSQHDTVVALVSHVPHLTAASLMCLADEASAEHEVVLRLAAGGFRDMTRIASGHPGIWPDICVQNSEAIGTSLDGLIEALSAVRDMVRSGDREALLTRLAQARRARVSLPTGLPDELELVEVRVAIADRAGELARLTTLAPEVNIYDFEIAHSPEGQQGIGIMVIAADQRDAFLAKLTDAGYSPSTRTLS